jgi:maltooligosyltrehalose synthase
MRLSQSGAPSGSVSLPDGEWSDVLSRTRVSGGGSVACDELFADLPVALLVREAE